MSFVLPLRMRMVHRGQGGGPYMLIGNAFSPPLAAPITQRTLEKPASSTADYYHMDGLYGFAPYDLNAMGTWGQTIATAKGYRYMWTIASDHPADDSGEEGGWGRDANSLYIAFSNDPAVLPDPKTMQRLINGAANASEGGVGPIAGSAAVAFSAFFNNMFLYNPDEATNKAYWYVGSAIGAGLGLNGHGELVFSAPDLDTEFTALAVSHPWTGNGLTGYQRVYRLGAGDWVSFGSTNDPDSNSGWQGKWESTDGKNFTKVAGSTLEPLEPTGGLRIGDRFFPNIGDSPFTDINGQAHRLVREDNELFAGDGNYVTMVAVDDDTGEILSSPAPVRVSNRYDGQFSHGYDSGEVLVVNLGIGAGHLQTVASYEEDGIEFGYACHGFFGDVGLPAASRNKLPENGGGLNEQFIDVYAYPIPGKEATAANAAPCGVRATCAAGVVTIAWYDVPAGRTYRVKRYASLSDANSDTNGSSPTDVTGTSHTESPTAGSVYYFRVWALNAGTPQQSRVCSTYVR
jgi:hypothetical protein